MTLAMDETKTTEQNVTENRSGNASGEEKGRTPKQRRERVQRLKKEIIAGVLFLLLFSLGLSIYSAVRLNHINRELLSTRASLDEITGLLKELQDFSGYTAASEESVKEDDTLIGSADPVIVDTDERLSGYARLDDVEQYDEAFKVYLTFDDGPSSHTGDILNILDSYGVKATFFVNGHEGFEDEYRRIVAEGHTLGMHSYSHKYSEIYMDLDSFADDFFEIQSYLMDVTGVESRVYRFPGGSGNTVSRVDIHDCINFLQEKDIAYFDWNVSSGDAVSPALSVTEIVTSVLSQVESQRANGVHTIVVLMHDAAGKETTVEALPIIIERISAMDNTVLLPITEETTQIYQVGL